MRIHHPTKPALQLLFEKRTLSIYGSMVKRFAQRKNKQDRIIQIERRLPFDLDGFRQWISAQFAHNVNSVIRCCYCTRVIDIGSFTADHVLPVNRGGGIGLDNLGLCCDECNLEKGQLTGEEFDKLNGFLAGLMEDVAKRDIRSRLRMGSGYRRLAFFANKHRKVQPSTDAPQLSLPEDF